MAVKISRNPLAFRSRSKEISVVVNTDQPDLGTVRVKVCELPKGLLQELRDDDSFYRKETDSLTSDIEACENRKEEDLARHRSAGAEVSDLFTLRYKHEGEAETYRLKRKEARRMHAGVQLSAIRWGVCDHNPEDFTDEETGEGFKFHEEPCDYDGTKYRVASQVTLQAYASVGLPFVQALFDAVNRWQRGEILTPQQVWQEAKARKDSMAAIFQAKLNELRGVKEAAPHDPLVPAETPKKTASSETQTT